MDRRQHIRRLGHELPERQVAALLRRLALHEGILLGVRIADSDDALRVAAQYPRNGQLEAFEIEPLELVNHRLMTLAAERREGRLLSEGGIQAGFQPREVEPAWTMSMAEGRRRRYRPRIHQHRWPATRP